MKQKILFVCLGNICRSPAADGIMRHVIEEKGLSEFYEIDSAGLYGGHAGDLPDHRMRIHARARGYELTHRSRTVKESDFNDFQYIIAMDDNNYARLKEMAPTLDDQKKIMRMADFIASFPHLDHVPDPYYEGAQGFELVLDMLEEGCVALTDFLEEKRKMTPGR